MRLQEAAGHSLSHAEFLELILQDELAVRSERQIGRRVKAAGFRELKTLEDFDWAFNPSIKKKQIFDLATCRFVRETPRRAAARPAGRRARATWSRPSATRRSRRASRCCTARSSTWSATSCTTRPSAGEDKVLARYLKPDLLIIDDMGMKQLPKRSGEYLFEIIMRRYENALDDDDRNRPLEDWGKLIGDVPIATAILDRFLHHAEIITITGKSYRLKGRSAEKPADPPCEDTAP